LSKHLSAGIQFSKSIDFAEYHQHLTEGALIYANPQDSLRLIKEHGYTPVARSSNLFDEIVFIASLKENEPSMDDIQDNEVISVNSMMVTRVGMKYLLDKNIKPTGVRTQATWMAVVKSIYTRNHSTCRFIARILKCADCVILSSNRTTITLIRCLASPSIIHTRKQQIE
jgi:hypothetical protein